MPAPIPASASHGDSLRAARVRSRAGMGMDLTSYAEDEMLDVRAHYAGLVKQIDHEVGEISRRAAAQRASGQHGHRLRHRPRRSPGRPRHRGQGDLLRVRGPHPPDGARPGQDTGRRLPGPGRVAGRNCHDARAGRLCPTRLHGRAAPPGPWGWRAPRRATISLATSPSRGWPSTGATSWPSTAATADPERLTSLTSKPTRTSRITCSPRPAQRSTRSTAVWTPLSRGELMSSMAFSMHDRLPMPYSMSGDEHEAREGWNWPYPSPASAAVQVEDPY